MKRRNLISGCACFLILDIISDQCRLHRYISCHDPTLQNRLRYAAQFLHLNGCLLLCWASLLLPGDLKSIRPPIGRPQLEAKALFPTMLLETTESPWGAEKTCSISLIWIRLSLYIYRYIACKRKQISVYQSANHYWNQWSSLSLFWLFLLRSEGLRLGFTCSHILVTLSRISLICFKFRIMQLTVVTWRDDIINIQVNSHLLAYP